MKHHVSRRAAPWLAAAATLATSALAPASAQTAAAPAAPAAPAAWSDTLKFGLQIEGGIVGNTNNPRNSNNFGQLFTDKSNDFQLNQILVGVGRPLDPKATDYDFGFKLQGLIGTDARYTRWVDSGKQGNSRVQGDVVEANILLHTPWLTSGGIDFKAGLYSTPMGAETIDPSTNAFYSHTYIFNFGLPLKHTGGLMTAHLTDVVDLYAGVDSGVNTTIGVNNGDNNGAAAFMGGIGLNLLGGNLTVLALAHIGPENPVRTVPKANGYNRYYGDIVAIWKATDKLTITAEGNYVHDDNPNLVSAATVGAGGSSGTPSAYGIALYGSYAVTDTLAVNLRGESFTDTKNFFVAGFTNVNDPNNAQSGFPAPSAFGGVLGKGTTYGAITLGLTYKPALDAFKLPGALMIRPEVRYDTALSGGKPFQNSSGGATNGVFTVASDFVLTF